MRDREDPLGLDQVRPVDHHAVEVDDASLRVGVERRHDPARVLELGCGLGLPSLAAALAGGRVLATDWAPEALAAVRVNAERNDIEVETLGTDDRDLARLVLSDLVGNAVNAGAGVIGVRVAREAAHLVIEVRDDAPPMPPSVWKGPGTSSARLESRLVGLDGSLTSRPEGRTKLVVARWTVRASRAEVGDGDDGAGAAG